MARQQKADPTRRRRWLIKVDSDKRFHNGEARAIRITADFSDDHLKDVWPSARAVVERSGNTVSVATVKRAWSKAVEYHYMTRRQDKRRRTDPTNPQRDKLQGPSTTHFRFPEHDTASVDQGPGQRPGDTASNDKSPDRTLYHEDQSRCIVGDTENRRFLEPSSPSAAPEGAPASAPQPDQAPATDGQPASKARVQRLLDDLGCLTDAEDRVFAPRVAQAHLPPAYAYDKDDEPIPNPALTVQDLEEYRALLDGFLAERKEQEVKAAIKVAHAKRCDDWWQELSVYVAERAPLNPNGCASYILNRLQATALKVHYRLPKSLHEPLKRPYCARPTAEQFDALEEALAGIKEAL